MDVGRMIVAHNSASTDAGMAVEGAIGIGEGLGRHGTSS